MTQDSCILLTLRKPLRTLIGAYLGSAKMFHDFGLTQFPPANFGPRLYGLSQCGSTTGPRTEFYGQRAFLVLI